MKLESNPSSSKWSLALSIVAMFGVINMLGDMVHESARSVNGWYLSLVGVTATQISLVYGVGEFFGYALRLLAGSLLDRTGKHWLFMFIEYGLHIVSLAKSYFDVLGYFRGLRVSLLLCGFFFQ